MRDRDAEISALSSLLIRFESQGKINTVGGSNGSQPEPEDKGTVRVRAISG